MAKWRVYRKNVTAAQGKAIVDKLIKNGKVWGKTVTSTNIYNKFTIHIK
jgi:hypothetical protein